VLLNSVTGKEISDFTNPDKNAAIKPGDFKLQRYEWGAVYNAMLLAGNIFKDHRYTEYTSKRIKFLASIVSYYQLFEKKYPDVNHPLKQMLGPTALVDAGPMCAAMIRANLADINAPTRTLIDTAISFIMTKTYRLADGTFARNSPMPNTLWSDDMYMGAPALAQRGKLTGERKFFDEAVRQIKLFSKRLFNAEKRLYMHGWVEGMDVHPQFYWGRGNGWALLALVEVLDALPSDHPERKDVLALLQSHVQGLSSCQSEEGSWHQLLDRPDSYHETSATAIFSYCIANAVNKGWISRETYGPVALRAWNAIRTKVNAKGQVEGTCVGTGMAFDAEFYYDRPVDVYAAHGYGQVLFAGAAVYKMISDHPYEIVNGRITFLK
jgi:unsaturated rhamnogalacturonyl hydrolase